MSPRSYDCIVVGARAAGASTALLLARRGARVLVLDSGMLGSDTLSTHFIWPRGARHLEEWGLLSQLRSARTPPIGRIRFDPGYARISAAPPVEAWCPRRTVLDRLLVEAAMAAGAEVRHGTRVDGLLEEGGRVVGVRHRRGSERAGLVVGADGRHSTVSRLVGAEAVESSPPQTGGFYAYFEGLPTEDAEFRHGEGHVTYLWPTNDSLTLVYIAVAAPGFPRLRANIREGFAAVAAGDDGVRERIRCARQVSPARGFTGEGPARRRRTGAGWVLIGDAASFKDPTAGMGISEAFADAAWLGEAAAAGIIEPCAGAREPEATRIFEFCRRVAELRAPETWLADVYRQVAGDPTWSGELLRMLGGEVAPADFFKRFAESGRRVRETQSVRVADIGRARSHVEGQMSRRARPVDKHCPGSR